VGNLGYVPDLPDLRDKTFHDRKSLPEGVERTLAKLKERNLAQIPEKDRKTKAGKVAAAKMAGSYLLDDLDLPTDTVHDLRLTGCLSPVEDQGSLGSCTAHAVIGLVEYLLRSGNGSREDMSRLFLYRTTRRLLGWTGDTGAYIRSTIKAMVVFGVPPERLWQYWPSELDTEPDAFLYSYAQTFKASTYVRLDAYTSTPEENCEMIKRSLLDGFPVAFGFPVYSSINEVGPHNGFEIPYPKPHDDLEGGHAVLAVGFDDSRKAFIIRNSWGATWGEGGYAYLPYEYFEQGLAVDCWTIFNQDWINLDYFE
jgi:C1A family cysteine protease